MWARQGQYLVWLLCHFFCTEWYGLFLSKRGLKMVFKASRWIKTVSAISLRSITSLIKNDRITRVFQVFPSFSEKSHSPSALCYLFLFFQEGIGRLWIRSATCTRRCGGPRGEAHAAHATVAMPLKCFEVSIVPWGEQKRNSNNHGASPWVKNLLLLLHKLLRIMGPFRSWGTVCSSGCCRSWQLLVRIRMLDNCEDWWRRRANMKQVTWRHDLKLLFSIPVGHRQSHTGVIRPMHCMVPGEVYRPDKSRIPPLPHIFEDFPKGWPFFQNSVRPLPWIWQFHLLLSVALVDELEVKRVCLNKALLWPYIFLGGGR